MQCPKIYIGILLFLLAVPVLPAAWCALACLKLLQGVQRGKKIPGHDNMKRGNNEK